MVTLLTCLRTSNSNLYNNNKTTILKIVLMLSVVTIMMLIPGGIIIPVHAAPGDQLLTINNPTPEIDEPSAGHLLDGGDGSDLCVANGKKLINTIYCEITVT